MSARRSHTRLSSRLHNPPPPDLRYGSLPSRLFRAATTTPSKMLSIMKPSLITRLLKSLLRIIGILLLIAVVLVGVIDWQGRGQLDEFCSNARPGTSLSELSEQARRGGIRLRLPGLEISEKRWRTFAVYSAVRDELCEIEHDGERVLAVKRNSLD